MLVVLALPLPFEIRRPTVSVVLVCNAPSSSFQPARAPNPFRSIHSPRSTSETKRSLRDTSKAALGVGKNPSPKRLPMLNSFF